MEIIWSKWFVVRLMIIAFGITGVFMDIPQNNSPAILPLFILLASPLMLLFVIGTQAINPFSAKVWELPSWHSNPFNLKQPLQFFHLGSYLMMVSGISLIIFSLIKSINITPLHFSFFSFGLGCLLGVKLCILVFRWKYA